MSKGKIIAIIGPNGSGKSKYVDQMRRTLASSSARYITFRDSYGANIDGAYYLQLRWNQHDIDQETPTVGELLERSYRLTGEETKERRKLQSNIYQMFSIESLKEKYVISLSSGELRKLQLTRTLMGNPQILIIDNPFIGLDAEARQLLRDLLQKLVKEREMTIYIVVSREKDIPDFVTERIEMEQTVKRPEPDLDAIMNLPYKSGEYQAEEVVRMRNVSIRYGERTILSNLDWTVHNGEHWALSGRNGSGKSTLLSLVCADNPQGYACDISLFGWARGSGETIWQIKRHIGYVSPEMHRSYHRDIPALRIVASGLKDTVGLYVLPTEKEKEQCRWWMRVFGIEDLAERSFLKMSSGEQRLVLLARAFVKDPELLILDEPLHGLDDDNRRRVKSIIEAFCQRRNKTLIFVTHYEEDLPPCIDHRIYL